MTKEFTVENNITQILSSNEILKADSKVFLDKNENSLGDYLNKIRQESHCDTNLELSQNTKYLFIK